MNVMSSSNFHRSLLQGLYVILDPDLFPDTNLVDAVQLMAKTGVRIFQYRDKSASMKDALHQLLPLREATANLQVLLIINDRCDLAKAIGADGLHLGQDDLPVNEARTQLGAEAIIGLSTHNLIQVQEASTRGADYIGFGPIFPTSTKHHHEPPVGIEGLRDIRRHTTLPLFAIGGITQPSVASLYEAGADGIAVASALSKGPDLQTTVKSFLVHRP